jgi:hydrogenase expression/formation protein HypC
MCLAIPGKIETLEGEGTTRMGKVNFSGIKKDINFAYVPEAKVGQYCLVHVGLALTIVDEVEAQRVFEYLKEIGKSIEDSDVL